MHKTYRELMFYDSFEDRYEYLRITNLIGADTFGHERYLNQTFYKSPEWKQARRLAIIRDNAFDLAHPDMPIFGKIIVHHINPITVEDVIDRSDLLFDLDNLVTVSHDTHNAIHFGNGINKNTPAERSPGDTKLW